MKKLITLCTLLLCAVVTSWADTKPSISGITLPDAPSGTLAMSSQSDFTADANGWIVFSPKAEGTNNKAYWSCNATNGNSRSWGKPDNATAPFVGGSSKTSFALQKARVHAFRFTGANTFSVLGKSGGTGRYIHVALYSYDETTFTLIKDKSDKSNNTVEFLFEGLSLETTYVAYFYGSDTSNSDLYEVALKSPAGPTITTQPVGADYAIGDPINALTVEAEAASGTLAYQWYLDGTPLSGANSDSYTPLVAGSYSVEVTDDAGSVMSDVAIITISAASAPTISVTGAPVGDIVVGTTVTLAAVAEGVPSPTIQWYSNTTATTSGGVALDGETSETYSPSTAAAGTYYFYAVATNSEGSATSTVQTMVVKEKVSTPKMPDAGYFSTATKTIEITCATDEATIEYSLDEGTNWTTYTEALDISADATVWARATKDGCIDSEVAKATYQKFEYDKSGLAPVGTETTWDLTLAKTQQLNGVSKVTSSDEYTYADIDDIYDLGFPNTFNGAGLMFMGEYPVRSGYAQNCTFRIHVTKPGTIKVEFSNTGGSNKGRWVRVTDAYRTQIGTVEAVGTTKRNETFEVVAGDVIISGVNSEDAFASLRYMSIKYTPVTSVSSTIPESGFCTYSTNYPVDLSTITGGAAYIATGAADGKVTLTKCEAKVPAATGLLIAGTDETITINTTADATEAPAGNLLVGMPNGGAVPAGKYVFAWTTGAPADAGFYKLDSELANIGNNKAYLDTAAGGGARLSLSFGEDAGEATGISEMKSQKADGAIFNLRGQRVAQPQKGLYILNGKKTIVK